MLRIGNVCEFSPCRKWRYTLWREWEVDRGLFDGPRVNQFLMAVLLNPSKANETDSDPTVTRMIVRARALGFGALCVCNLFAYMATDPEEMKAQADPVGANNDYWLTTIAAQAGMILAGWGGHGAHMKRGANVAKMLPAMQCLWVNSDGTPKHPLYCGYKLTPFPYVPSLSPVCSN